MAHLWSYFRSSRERRVQFSQFTGHGVLDRSRSLGGAHVSALAARDRPILRMGPLTVLGLVEVELTHWPSQTELGTAG